ncbi:MAG: pyridoxamine 5'-phosphate oxidase family protein [Deltaproteobacteria bacterium]|nr:pyridoxamine 5'-phosphate oxidase family protein [Deltaproteobacteria bacterium]
MKHRAEVTPELAAFIAEQDAFFLGTASADGQPYIQHRGGPQGFLRVVGERTLAFADFSGNRQYITVGNLAENPRAFIFLLDHRRRRRIKLWGRARVVEGDAALLAAVATPGYSAEVERIITFEVERWDINCPQHIPVRYTEAEWSTRAG